MFKRLKVKLYPTIKQKNVLEDHFNAYRYIYNLCLEYRIMLWRDYKLSASGNEMAKQVLEIRKDTPWLLKCKAECVREAAYSVDKTYKKFFKGSGYPKFKSKKGEQSFHAYQSITCRGHILTFFKQKIKFKTSDDYIELLNTNKIKQVTFKNDLCGDYWATFLIELPDVDKMGMSSNVIGLDM